MHGLSGLQGWERHCEGAQTGVPNRARSQMPRYAKILHIIGCCMGSASVVLAVDAETNWFQIVWNRLTWGGWSLGCMACRTWFKGTILTWVCCCAFLGCKQLCSARWWWKTMSNSWVLLMSCNHMLKLRVVQSEFVGLNCCGDWLSINSWTVHGAVLLHSSSGHENGTWKDVRWECVSWVLFRKWLHMVAHGCQCGERPWPCPVRIETMSNSWVLMIELQLHQNWGHFYSLLLWMCFTPPFSVLAYWRHF